MEVGAVERRFRQAAMGLDGVELVMAFEDAFGVEITDADALKMFTPQDVIDFVAQKVELTDEETCLEQAAFHLVRSTVMEITSAERRALRPTTPLSHIFMLTPQREISARLSAKLRTSARLPIDSMTTMGDLAIHVAGTAAHLVKRGKPWSIQQIARVVQQLTIAQTGISENEYGFTRRFVEDFGID